MKDVDKKPSKCAKVTSNSNKASIGAGVRQTIKMKTMTNIKQNIDGNQGLDQLAEFLNNKIIRYIL